MKKWDISRPLLWAERGMLFLSSSEITVALYLGWHCDPFWHVHLVAAVAMMFGGLSFSIARRVVRLEGRMMAVEKLSLATAECVVPREEGA